MDTLHTRNDIKLVTLNIPANKTLPDDLLTFSPEETFLMISIGHDVILQGRHSVASLTLSEVQQKFRDDLQKATMEFERDKQNERTVASQVQTAVKNMYENQIAETNKQLQLAVAQLKLYEEQKEVELRREADKIKDRYDALCQEKDRHLVLIQLQLQKTQSQLENFEDNKKASVAEECLRVREMYDNIVQEKQKQIGEIQVRLQKTESQFEQMAELHRVSLEQINESNKVSLIEEVCKVREQCNILLQEKERQVERMMESHEKLVVASTASSHKTSIAKGSEGERIFEELARTTFLDFKSFSIADKHAQGSEGDFHLHFEEFDVLVDSKNYKRKVPLDQIEKIKHDLTKNQHIQFGWLVALNNSIDKQDRSPITFEWINTSQCLVYINHLLSFDEPSKVLRIAWFTCKELKRMIGEESNTEQSELTQLRERHMTQIDRIKNTRKHIRELNTNLNTSKTILRTLDDELRHIIESETSCLVDSHFSIFDSWWDNAVDYCGVGSSLVSTDMWRRFKQDSKDLLKDIDITVEQFRNFIQSKVPTSSIDTQTKATFVVKGIAWKSAEKQMETECADISSPPDIVPPPSPELTKSPSKKKKLHPQKTTLDLYISNKKLKNSA